METKVCVTGAAGYLGSSFVKRLGYIIYCYAMQPQGIWVTFSSTLDLVEEYASSKAASEKELLRYGSGEIETPLSGFTRHKEQIVVRHPKIFGGIVAKSFDFAPRGCLRRSYFVHGEC
ncbi:hypothetical protein V6N13_087007 [Hibiscus sabdariffa]